MYESYYGLSDAPFRLNPDPAFLFESVGHRRALANLEYGIHKREGFIVLTGDVGTGKTTLVLKLLQRLATEPITAVQIVSTLLDADDVLRWVAAAFGVEPAGADKASLLNQLIQYFVALDSAGKRALLIVDEAQNLTGPAIEELRMLSNYQIGNRSLLQTFLIGQPEFRDVIASPALHQLRQRVLASYHLGPLDASEIRGYVEHRLNQAAWNGHPTVDVDAYAAVYRITEGVPRRINALFDRVLLAGFLNEQDLVTAADVDEAAAELLPEAADAKPPSAPPGATAADSEGEPLLAILNQLASVQAALQQFYSTHKKP